MNDMNRNGRSRRLHAGALLSGVALVVLAGGCSNKTTESTTTGKPDVNDTLSIAPAANDKKMFVAPFDAVPDSTGRTVYFTAVAPGEGPAVFKASADGSGLTKLASGAPLVSPFGITISEDDQTLLIADTGAETDTEEGGAVLTLSVNGGKPAALSGTAGTAPRGLEVQGDQLYYSGTSGKRPKAVPAVFKIAVVGGTPTALVSGLPLKDPSGIAVTRSGDVYVLDTAAAATRHATVFVVKGGVATAFVPDVMVGYPGGIALSQDDTTLFVSALDDTTARDVVFVTNVATKETSTFTKSIGKFSESAGLHRARHASVFAWADSNANKSGTVFVLK